MHASEASSAFWTEAQAEPLEPVLPATVRARLRAPLCEVVGAEA